MAEFGRQDLTILVIPPLEGKTTENTTAGTRTRTH